MLWLQWYEITFFLSFIIFYDNNNKKLTSAKRALQYLDLKKYAVVEGYFNQSRYGLCIDFASS